MSGPGDGWGWDDDADAARPVEPVPTGNPYATGEYEAGDPASDWRDDAEGADAVDDDLDGGIDGGEAEAEPWIDAGGEGFDTLEVAYMSPEQLDGSALDCRADIYSLGAVLYHLITGRPPFGAQEQAALVNQIYHQAPVAPSALRANVGAGVDALILRALAKQPAQRQSSWDEFSQALSALITNREVPRGQLQGVLDSERFTLLRGLEFFSGFGDVELWEVVHRASWQRLTLGHAIYRKGEEGRSFHIVAQGEVEVFRDGKKVAQLGAGTSVGEMAYLAPSADLRRHSAEVVVSVPATTISFTPETLAQVGPSCRHSFDDAFIRVLVRRLHAAHEALAHPRRIL